MEGVVRTGCRTTDRGHAMRPGPSLEALAGPVAIGARIDVHLGGGGRVLALDIPAEDIQIDWSSERVVPGKLTYRCPAEWIPESPAAPLANFGQRSHVVALLDTTEGRHEVDLGWWQHQTWEEQDHGDVKVECLDLLQILEQNPMTWPSSPPRGATLLSEAQRIAWTLPVILDPGVQNSWVSPSAQWGHSRTEAIRDLCTARNLHWGVKSDGCLHLWARRDGGSPDARYTGRDLLASAPRKSGERRPNRWVVTGSPQTGDTNTPAVKWTGTATVTSWPYEPSIYGYVTDRREFNVASSQNAVRAAASAYMRSALSASTVRHVEIASDPRLEAGDVIAVHTDAGEVIVGRVTAYSLPVDSPDSLMRVDMEVLAW